MASPSLVLLLALGPLLAQSADPVVRAGQQERARKARIKKKAPVLDDEKLKECAGDAQLGEVDSAASPTPAAGTAPSPPPDTPPSAAREMTPEEYLASLKKTEGYWRDRMRTAERRIERLRDDIEIVKLKIMTLQSNLVVPGDPLREFNRKPEFDSMLREKSRLEAEIEQALKEPDRIREEGRRADARPAWFR